MNLPQATIDSVTEHIKKIRNRIIVKLVITPEDRIALLEKRIKKLESQVTQQKLQLYYHQSVIEQLTKWNR